MIREGITHSYNPMPTSTVRVTDCPVSNTQNICTHGIEKGTYKYVTFQEAVKLLNKHQRVAPPCRVERPEKRRSVQRKQGARQIPLPAAFLAQNPC